MVTTDLAVLEDVLPGVGDLYLYQINRVRTPLPVFSIGGADRQAVSAVYVVFGPVKQISWC